MIIDTPAVGIRIYRNALPEAMNIHRKTRRGAWFWQELIV